LCAQIREEAAHEPAEDSTQASESNPFREETIQGTGDESLDVAR